MREVCVSNGLGTVMAHGGSVMIDTSYNYHDVFQLPARAGGDAASPPADRTAITASEYSRDEVHISDAGREKSRKLSALSPEERAGGF